MTGGRGSDGQVRRLMGAGTGGGYSTFTGTASRDLDNQPNSQNINRGIE